MQHRSGRSSSPLTPARRITLWVSALVLLASGGLAGAVGTSFAGSSSALLRNLGLQRNTAFATQAATLQPALSRSSLTPGSTGGLWMSIGRTPTSDQIRALAPRYSVVVLNAWDLAAKALIRQINPKMLVLVYKDLASTRSYIGAVDNGRDAARLPTGVGYIEASSSAGWFATDSHGNRIQWGPYPGHWQMSVWLPGYQQRWTANVVRSLVHDHWDGVLADNDMQSLRYYSPAHLQGTKDAASSDARLRAGLQSLIEFAGPRVAAAGKQFIPNVSDGRLNLTRWKTASLYGGGMDENFSHWGTNGGRDYVGDWGSTGWVDQTTELSAPLTLTVTRAAPGDLQSLRYGYASALIRAVGRVVWTPSIVGDYSQPEWFAWEAVTTGLPTSVGLRQASGAWSRTFRHAFVAVNPLSTSATVIVPSGFGPLQLSIAPHDAKLLLR
jgi:hypothetical protein